MEPSFTEEYREFCVNRAIQSVFDLTGVVTKSSQFIKSTPLKTKLVSTSTCSYEGLDQDKPVYIIWKEFNEAKITYFYRGDVPKSIQKRTSSVIACKALPPEKFDELHKVASGKTELPTISAWNSMVDQYNDIESVRKAEDDLLLEMHIVNRLSDGFFSNTTDEIKQYARKLVANLSGDQS